MKDNSKIPPHEEYRREIHRLGFSYHYSLWRSFGFWTIPTDWTVPYYAFAFALNFPTCIVYNTILLLSLLEAENVNDIIEILVPTITTVVIVIQAILFAWNKTLLTKLFKVGNELLQVATLHDPEEHAYFLDAQRTSRTLLIGCSASVYCTISWRLIQTVLLAEERKLMWNAYIPFDWQHSASELPHIAAVAFLYFGTIYMGMLFSSMAIYGLQFYGTLSAFLDILAGRLDRLGWKAAGDGGAPVERKLIECIKYHHLCLKYNELINEMFGMHYFVQFFASGLVICVTSFKLSIVQPGDPKFIFYVMYLANMTTMLLIPCVYGSMIRHKSEQIPTHIYKSNWLAQSPRFHVAMKILITGAQRPVQLNTFEKWFIIELPTFVTICRAAYSLLSCLKAA